MLPFTLTVLSALAVMLIPLVAGAQFKLTEDQMFINIGASLSLSLSRLLLLPTPLLSSRFCPSLLALFRSDHKLCCAGKFIDELMKVRAAICSAHHTCSTTTHDRSLLNTQHARSLFDTYAQQQHLPCALFNASSLLNTTHMLFSSFSSEPASALQRSSSRSSSSSSQVYPPPQISRRPHKPVMMRDSVLRGGSEKQRG